MAAPLAERLAVREISVDQRRQAQQLIKAFTLGQMTRHYWGGFAQSLRFFEGPRATAAAVRGRA